VRTLSRYFVARFLTLFFTVLVGATIVIASVETLLNLDDMLRTGSGYAGSLSYLFLRIPSYYSKDLLPISGFAAALLCFGLAGHQRELLAARAGGLSLWQLCAPLLLAALAVAALVLAATETWVLESRRAFAQHEESRLDLRQGTLWYRSGQTVYNIGTVDPARGQVQQLAIFELGPDGRLVRRIQAESAELQLESEWELRNVVVEAFAPNSNAKPPTIQRLETLKVDFGSPTRDALLNANPDGLGTRQLFGAIETRKQRNEPHEDLETRLHLHLAAPATLFLLSLLGFALGLRVERAQSFGAPLVAGVGLLGVFYATRNGVETLSLAAIVPPWTIWALLLVFALGGTIALYRSPR